MDPKIKKAALRLFTYGLYAATAQHGDEVSMMTVNWLTQSSFDPPMVTLAVEADSHSCRVIAASRAFAINVYETGQRELAGQLGKTFAKHPEKHAGLAWRPGPATGSPVLELAIAWVECRVAGSLASGDHTLFVAEVVEAGLSRDSQPLTMKEAGFNYSG
jgi:flavin reductase (DIM6/NTAB) family NADH-FMN oxidoreductase RutF